MKIKNKTWTPTAKNINRLTEPIRKYIHHLATNADPAGTIAAAICQRENAEVLAKLVLELEAERNALLEAARELMSHLRNMNSAFDPRAARNATARGQSRRPTFSRECIDRNRADGGRALAAQRNSYTRKLPRSSAFVAGFVITGA